MISIKEISVLVLLAYVGVEASQNLQQVNKETVSRFLTCLQKQELNGNSALNLSSHNPLKQPYDFTFNLNFGPHISIIIGITQIKYFNYGNYAISVEQLASPSPTVSKFKISFTWKNVILDGKWNANLNFYNSKSVLTGPIKLNMVSRIWNGVATITDNKSVALKIISTVSGSVANFTGVGAAKENVDKSAAIFWEVLLNSKVYSQYISTWWSERYTQDWLLKPARIQSLLNLCK